MVYIYCWGLASAVFLLYDYRGTYYNILLSHLRLPKLGRPGFRISFLQEHGSPVYISL
jgi:hypothetical protein